jgi:3-oxoacyl-[acyl-carrier-protein] synthase-3
MSAGEMSFLEAPTEPGASTLMRLAHEWHTLKRPLALTPPARRLDRGVFTLADYQQLLLDLRPCGLDGHWVRRSPQPFDGGPADIAFVLLEQAEALPCDIAMLEADYLATGGDPDAFRLAPSSVGAEALQAYLTFRADKGPAGLVGALWILAQLNEHIATAWVERIEELLGLQRCCTRFLRLQAAGADVRSRLCALINLQCTSRSMADDIVQTARVAGRLRLLQLGGLDGEP